MKKKQEGENIFVLPLFVNNLRDALDIKKETTFRDTYVSMLNDKITSSVEELLTLLRACISANNEKCYPLRLKSLSKRKMMIHFYDELCRDIQTIKNNNRKISQETFNSIEAKLREKEQVFHKMYEDDVGGGIERRTISRFLDCKKKPSDKTRSELRFVMTQMYPAVLSQKVGTELDQVYQFERFESLFFKGILESPDSIVSIQKLNILWSSEI